MKTECVLVSDVGLRSTLFADDVHPAPALRSGGAQSGKCPGLNWSPGTLTGSGDLEKFEACRAITRDQPGGFMLSVNGIPFLTDARLIAMENVAGLALFRLWPRKMRPGSSSVLRCCPTERTL